MRAILRFLLEAVELLVTSMMWAVVRLYQIFLSPFFGQSCRFKPTCSNYFLLAIRKYGPWKGAIRGCYRILRCNPFNPGGWDPP